MTKDDLDLEERLSFVDPARRVIVRRRIEVIKEHLALDRSTIADGETAAAKLGLSLPSFYRLIRIWKGGQDARVVERLAGSDPRRKGRRPHPGDDFVKRTLATLPPGRPVARDAAAIQASARLAGVELRSLAGLVFLIRDLRASADLPRQEVGYATFVDHVALELPVHGPTATAMPIATVLGSVAAGTLSSALLGLEVPGPAQVARLLAQAIRTTAIIEASGSGRTRIGIDGTFDPTWRELYELLDRRGIDRVGEDRERLRGAQLGHTLLYPRMMGIRSQTRAINVVPEQRLPPDRRSLRNTLDVEYAQEFVEECLASAGTVAPIALPGPLPTLLADLERFAERLSI